MAGLGDNSNRAAKMLDDLVQEGLGQSHAAKGTAPILPKIKMVKPRGAAPIKVHKKDFSKKEKLPDIAELLPQIVKEASEKVQNENRQRQMIVADEIDLRGKVEPVFMSEESKALEAVLFKPGELKDGETDMPAWMYLSRVKRRYDLQYGHTPSAGLRTRHRPEMVHSDLQDKAIYSAREGKGTYGIPSGFFHNPRTVAWIFLAPALIAFALFSWLPMLRGVFLSLGDVSLSGDFHFVGLENYVRAFTDPQFLGALWHATALCLLSLILGFVLPVALAIYMNELRKGQSWVRLAFFLPFLTPTVPAVILWRWIFDQGYGLINSVLAYLPLGNPHIPWLNEPHLALVSIVLVFIWKNTGWNALIYWTSLQDVPEELYETAEMDGTNLWQRIKHVSIPALRGTMGVLMIMQVINTVQIFTEVYLMTGGGPMGSTEVITTYMYKKSFLYLDIGYASAMAVILFGVLLSFTALRMRHIEEDG